jgi:phage FluMu gp28-like protein
VWVASRQIGKSFALAFEAAISAAVEARNVLLVSASLRQSKALMRKVYQHLKALNMLTGNAIEAERENREECQLANGASIFSLPANPDTIRGFSADVYLDEFALHRDSRAIWAAIFPSITRGFKLRVASTPLGKQGKFWDLWSRNKAFAKHQTTILDASTQGLDIDPEELRLALDDPELWEQEYLCQFLDETTAFLSHDLISSCEFDPDVDDVPMATADDDLYLGVDIGRRKDLSVFWPLLAVANVYWSQEIKVLEKKPFREQRQVLYELLEKSRRGCIDETGIGMQLAEEAQDKYGSKVEPVSFTSKTKEKLAYQTRSRMQDRGLRIPIDRDIHNDLHSIKKVITPAGNERFDVDQSETKGHGDRFWALALAVEAASTPAGKIEYQSVSKRRMNDGDDSYGRRGIF